MAPAFDPFNQVLTIINKNGEPLPLPMPYLDLYIHYGCRMCINYGVQLGATIMVLILVLILTNPERRKSPVFALNVAALGFNMARAVCRVLFFVSPWNEVYAIFTFDYSRVSKGDYAASLLAVIFSVLVILCIEISLVFQIQVLCATLRRLYRYPLIGISYCVAIGMLISRIWLAAEDCKRILHNAPGYATAELQKVNSILLTVINVWFCAVFAGKLGFAMHLRRRLGIKKLGPMKVLFIMGCQTMIVPAIFAILQFVVNVPDFAANCITLITISLPLSALWAGSTLETENSSAGRESRSSASSRCLISMGSASTARTICFADRNPRRQQDLETGDRDINVAHDISVVDTADYDRYTNKTPDVDTTRVN